MKESRFHFTTAKCELEAKSADMESKLRENEITVTFTINQVLAPKSRMLEPQEQLAPLVSPEQHLASESARKHEGEWAVRERACGAGAESAEAHAHRGKDEEESQQVQARAESLAR
jgi:hypothetical protein